MYQAFVIGLGVLSLVGIGYYIDDSYRNNLASIFSHEQASSTHEQTIDHLSSLAGTYICDSSSGCENERELTIASNGSVSMETAFDGGVEVLRESGSWSVDGQGRLVVLLTGTDSGTYDIPRVILSREVNETALTKVLVDKSIYTDVKNPTFKKEL